MPPVMAKLMGFDAETTGMPAAYTVSLGVKVTLPLSGAPLPSLKVPVMVV
jgi:hypothetical protein